MHYIFENPYLNLIPKQFIQHYLEDKEINVLTIQTYKADSRTMELKVSSKYKSAEVARENVLKQSLSRNNRTAC